MTPTPIQPPVIRTGEDVYNMIMGKIEPELTLDQIPLLDEKYKDESEQEKQSRLTRYQKAYDEYDKQYQQYLAEEEGKLHTFRKAVLDGVENRSRDDDENGLKSIESAISDL